jgi:hypothetical protein
MTPRDSKFVGSQQIAPAIALGLLALLATFAPAAEPTVAYRRILVPADSPATWPREGATFVPVESRDFDAWVTAANQPPSTANIAEARYAARLADNELDEDEPLGGRGTWQVELHGNQPALIPLKNTSLAFHNVRWRGAAGEPARLGWWPAGDGESPFYALEVPRSGELEFDWRLTAAPSSPEFPLRMPVAARTELVLDVPSGRRPVLDGGSLRESPPQPQNGGRWVFALPPASAVLRFEDPAAPKKVSITTALHENLHYVVSKRGVELQAELELADATSARRQLDVVLHADWRVIEAAVGDQQLTWRATVADKAADSARIAIQLPDVPSNRPTTVTLRAWRSHSVGEPLRLPMLAIDDAFWTSGSIQLTLDESLQLSKLAPIDCVQTAAHAGDDIQTPSESSRRLSFAAFTPSAAVEVALAHRPVVGRVAMGTTLDVGNPNVAGRLVVDVSVERGTLHQLRADVQRGWTIDAVETVPATALGEWYVDRADQRQTFELQLDRAVTSDQPIRVVITGRLERTATLEPLPLIALNPLTWRGLSVSRNLLQLRAAEQFELEPAGDLQYLEASGLTAPERTLLMDPRAGRICELTANSSDAAIRLAPKKGAYDATVQLDFALCRGHLQQTYRVECRPRGSGIDHVLVFLSEPPPEPLRWIEVHSNEPLVAERMPPSDPRLRGLPPGGELWLLDLRRLYIRPIALSATWSSPWAGRRRVPLVSLPDASMQQGRVTVAGGGAELPTIVAQRMSPAPLPIAPLKPAVGDLPLATRAVYRFQPTRFYDAERAAELWIGPAPADSDVTQMLATHVDVESRFSADGSGMHHVSYQLQNLGADSLELTLPRGVRLEAARLDGQLVSNTRPDTVTVPWSSGRSDAILKLELSSRYPPLAGGDQLPSPLPTGPLQILAGQWSISLPHGFTALHATDGSTTTRLDWRKRLFGPLARAQNERPFNPLVAHDWNLLWADLSRAVTTPARAESNSPSSESSMPTGWDSFRVEFVAGPPAAITLAHRPATAAVALAVFIVSAAGAPLCGLRRRTLVQLVLATAACSLFLPVQYVPWATAATLGFAAAVLWQWSRRLVDKGRPAVALLATLAVVASASADAPPPTSTIERVLVPVDSAGKPAGTKCFVSTSFLRLLVGAAAKTPTDRTWLFTDMRCDGELIPRQEQAGLRAASWMLTCEIETFARDAAIELPLVKREANWSPVASLDGIPTPIEWDASGRGCMVRVAEPGHSRLTISFVPRLGEAGGRQQLALSLPQIMGAGLSIATPATLNDLSGDSITYSRRDEPNRTVWRGNLNSAGQLTANWPANFATASADPNYQVDELCTLRIHPAGIILEATFLLNNVAAWPRAIEVAVDDGWEPLFDHPNPPSGDLKRLPDGRSVFHFRPTPVTDNDRKFTLRFRARGSSTLGRIRLPNVELLSLKAENRWFAVGWDSAFDCMPSTPQPANANPPADFANEWAASGLPAPQILLDAARLDADWFLHVRPRAEASTCRELLSLAAGKDRFRVDYCVDVSPRDAACFCWSLSVPAKLMVASLTATTDGETIPLDWIRSTPNRLDTFFARTTSRPYRLHLVGSLPSAAGGRTRLPRITSAGQPQKMQTVALYRDSNMLAKWQFAGKTSWPESSAVQSPPFGEDSHFVRAHNIDSQTTGDVHIVVEPNQPVVSGKTLTNVFRENDVWSATFQCDLQVERGELDTLRLQIPSNWAGPFTLTPAAQANVVASGRSDGKSTLAIQLPQSARPGDVLRLQVRSPLALVEGKLPAAPQIALLHPGSRESFLALPDSIEGEPAVWTHRGIEPAELPRGLRPHSPSPQPEETFRITADSFNVALRPRNDRASSASIRLAETAVHVGSAEGMLTLTRFVLAPEGLDQCVVKLPAGERLVRSTLGGHPALARQLDPRRVQVQLGPPNLPQSLDVVTRTVERPQDLSQLVEMRRPVLEQSGQPIPVEFSLWTLYRAPRGETARVTGGALVTPAELAATRLDRMVSISQSATRAVIESPVVDGYSWFADWVHSLEDVQRVAHSLHHSAAGLIDAIRVPQTIDPVSDAATRCDAWIEQIAEVFAATDWAASPVATMGPSNLDPWLDAPNGADDRVCLISDGNENDATVEFVPEGMTAGQTRFVLLATLAAVAAAAVWLVRNPPALRLAEKWPEATGLGLGLLAWAWLRPSILGLVIAAVSLALLARRIIRERKSPRHDSSDQPNSIPEEVAKH